MNVDLLLNKIISGNYNALARAITLIENDLEPAEELLKAMTVDYNVPVVGLTGPPGAGKSTLVNAITEHLSNQGKKIAVLAVDPTSPFNFGSLLGDRIRMSPQFNKSNVYIRSLATRGALGGISAKTIEITDLLRTAGFDLILIETVGVGQSEIDIAGLADKTIVVLVPESGDEIQNIKSGLMEIAQAFVVNKSDREGSDIFANNLKKFVHHHKEQIDIFKTSADKNIGVAEVCEWIMQPTAKRNDRKPLLLTEKAFKLIQHKRMKNLNKKHLGKKLEEALEQPNFNIYRFVDSWKDDLCQGI